MSPIIEIDLWTFLGGVASAVLTIAGMLIAVIKWQSAKDAKGLDLRFAEQEKARESNGRHWDSRFTALEAAARQDAGQWQRVERELLSLKAELPLNYVRREDYAQSTAMIMAKLDGLTLRMENIVLRGVKRDE